MDNSALDNPFWSALRTRHRAIARVAGEAARYPADYAPFLGIAHASVGPGALDALMAPGESVYMLGVVPDMVQRGWELQPFRPLAQMVREAPMDVADGPAVVALSPAQRPDVLALTALVYPHYFRERTMELGRYFGIYIEGRLAAMIGERLGTGDATELSAICTHPDFSGRGLARRLTALLANDILVQGRTPLLHVSHENLRAKALYEHMGFRLRRDIGFWALRRC
jgi:ribosomal protein S18 acetylase RimI-like enzyme